MAKVESGAAKIRIEAENATGPAFRGVNENFENFKKHLASVEDNLKPFQAVMKGGVAITGLGTGMTAVATQAGMLSNSFRSLSGSAASAAGPLGQINAIINDGGWTEFGAKMTKVAIGAMAAFEAIKQIVIAYQALRAIVLAVNLAVYVHAEAEAAKTAASMAGAAATGVEAGASIAGAKATGVETAAKVACAGATHTEAVAKTESAVASGVEAAASTVCATEIAKEAMARAALTTVLYAETESRSIGTAAAMEDAIARAAGLKTRLLESGATVTTIAGVFKETSARAGGTVALLTHTAAEKTSTIAKTASAAATTGSSAALGWYAWCCNAAAVATNFLTTSMGLNPFAAWAVAITAAVAAVAAIAVAIYGFCNGAQKRVEAMEAEAEAEVEAAGKAAESYKRFLETTRQDDKASDARLERLKQLQERTILVGKELDEAKRLAKELNEEYSLGIGISYNNWDETEGSLHISNDADWQLKAQQASGRSELLAREREELYKQNYSGAVDQETIDKNNERLKQIRVELDYYNDDGIEDVTGKTEAEIIQMRIDGEKKIKEERKKTEEEVKKRAEEAAKKNAEEKSLLDGATELRKSIEKTIADQTKSAMDKEIEAAQEIVDKKKAELDLAIEQGKISKALAIFELDRLQKQADLRKSQIKERFKLEADAFYNSAQEKIAQEKQARDTAQYDKDLSNKIADNPFEAIRQIQIQLATASKAFIAADAAYQKQLSAAKTDGFISDEEKKQLTELEKTRTSAMKRAETMTGFSSSAEAKIQEGVKALLQQSRDIEATPIDAAQRGSVEAYKQAMENRARAQGDKSPEAREAEAIKKQLTKQYEEQKRKKDEEIKIAKQIVESLKGAAI